MRLRCGLPARARSFRLNGAFGCFLLNLVPCGFHALPMLYSHLRIRLPLGGETVSPRKCLAQRKMYFRFAKGRFSRYRN
jgi:hypothetical protein